jgi:RNA polymerase sigma factor (sigma-70 family)
MRAKQAAVRQLELLFRNGIVGDLSDSQLLERFTTRDRETAECAFTALVERHGPMVLRVCRNVVSDPHDAQDAFQATFLVLVQQAHRLWVRDSLAPWLHRVAQRVASRIRASRRERRQHERRAAESRPAWFARDSAWHELVSVLHEEIDLLPARLRTAVVLCDLQGVTHERAAKDLGWPLGTVKSRLVRARELLRGRLSRRGLVLPGGLLIAEVTTNAAEAPLSLALVDSLIQAGAALAARQPAALGVISSQVARLAEEVQKTMFLTKLKVISMAVLVGGSLTAGAAGVLAQQGGTADTRPAYSGSATTRVHAAQEASASQASPAAPFIRQSRPMIVTRLEQEHALARDRLERTLRRVRSSTDPEVVQARKTVTALEDLLARIDVVLVDGVEKYPTVFDFSRGTTDSSAAPSPSYGRGGSARINDTTDSQLPEDEELARARDRAKWVRRQRELEYLRDNMAQSPSQPAHRQQQARSNQSDRQELPSGNRTNEPSERSSNPGNQANGASHQQSSESQPQSQSSQSASPQNSQRAQPQSDSQQEQQQPGSSPGRGETGSRGKESSGSGSASENPQSGKSGQSARGASTERSQSDGSKLNHSASPGFGSSQRANESSASKDGQSSRVASDIRKEQDRVDWAERMFEKGYVSQEQYDAALRKYYETLRSLLTDGVTSAVREEYEELKARFEQRPKTQEVEKAGGRGGFGSGSKSGSQPSGDAAGSRSSGRDRWEKAFGTRRRQTGAQKEPTRHEVGKPESRNDSDKEASRQEAGKSAPGSDDGKDRTKQPPKHQD